VQPELWKSANFAEASSIPGLNPNQAEYFKKTYYLHSKLCEEARGGPTDEGKSNGDPLLSHKEENLAR
jgi:hypothetical protein